MQTQWMASLGIFENSVKKESFNIDSIIMFFHSNFLLRCRKTVLLFYIIQNYRNPLDNFLYFNITESWIFSRGYVYILDVHGSVHLNINLIEITNKMRPCSRIYYSNVF